MPRSAPLASGHTAPSGAGQRVTPAQLKAIEACVLGKVSQMVGAAGWVRPGSVRPSVLDRVLALGLIEAGPTRFFGASQIRTGRAALDAEKALA